MEGGTQTYRNGTGCVTDFALMITALEVFSLAVSRLAASGVRDGLILLVPVDLYNAMNIADFIAKY